MIGDPWSHSRADVRHADALYANAGNLQTLALLATAAVFIIWFHRVRTNADVLAADVCTRGRGWTIGGWFIPIANLWIPYQVAGEIWTASAQTAPDGSWRAVSQRPLTVWWGVWMTSLLIGRAAWALSRNADTLDELRRATDFMIFSDALGAAAAILAIVFVRRLTAMQDVKAAEGPSASS
ncbi:DUF4328 domain-containing protein [Streptomyces sp. NBC_00442]|uniref:DUF4328 domain-containing protein n=1 Tax=Streptomyces sp. NBC_00442 TaxID=2903651 RepID=UPI002E1E9470